MRDAYSHRIRRKTIEYLDSFSPKIVHSYISFGSEVSTHGIIQDLFDRKIKVVVPLTRGEKNNEYMIHSQIEDLEDLRPGNFNVPEPSVIKESSLDQLDAIIIPVVAFDGSGMRLGYGKGFYDKFLSRLDPKIARIGLAFSIQEMDKIPMLPHDELMNSLINEKSHFFFK